MTTPQPTMTVLERAAAKLAEVRGIRWDQCGQDGVLRREYLKEVRAVISSLREPSDGMVFAAMEDADNDSNAGMDSVTAIIIAAIDKALEQ